MKVPEGASGSSTITARLVAASGTPDQDSGGAMFSPSQVYFDGIAPPSSNAVLRRVIEVGASGSVVI